MVTDNEPNQKRYTIHINFGYLNHNVPIYEILSKLNLKTTPDKQYFFFTNRPQDKIKISTISNTGFDIEYQKKMTIIDIISEEKQYTPFQSALYLSISYPEGIMDIKDFNCLKLVTKNFFDTYHIKEEEYKKIDAHDGHINQYVSELDLSLKKVDFVLNSLSQRETSLREEQNSFFLTFKREHQLTITNENGIQETIHVKGFHSDDYNYILSVFNTEINRVQKMYSIFSKCYKELMEEKDKTNPDKNIFEEFERI